MAVTSKFDRQFKQVLDFERKNDPHQLTDYYGRSEIRQRTPFSQRPTPDTVIDLEGEEETIFDATGGSTSTVSETTPLLIGSEVGTVGAATGATAAVGSTGTSVLAGLGAGAGLVGGIGAAGYNVLKGLFAGGRKNPNEENVLRGHHFIGPGNIVGFQPPVNEADAVAKEHDIAYGNAKTAEDVNKADEEAIKGFQAAGGVSGHIGATGLRIKTGVEKITGVLYPSLTGKKWVLLVEIEVLHLILEIDLIGLTCTRGKDVTLSNNSIDIFRIVELQTLIFNLLLL